MADVGEYDADLRREISACIAELAPGEWGELAICPGPFGCLGDIELGDGPRAEIEHCSACRVIHLYRG